jgi:hypothetical protein
MPPNLACGNVGLGGLRSSAGAIRKCLFLLDFLGAGERRDPGTYFARHSQVCAPERQIPR